jgi:hypothetical protein
MALIGPGTVLGLRWARRWVRIVDGWNVRWNWLEELHAAGILVGGNTILSIRQSKIPFHHFLNVRVMCLSILPVAATAALS